MSGVTAPRWRSRLLLLTSKVRNKVNEVVQHAPGRSAIPRLLRIAAAQPAASGPTAAAVSLSVRPNCCTNCKLPSGCADNRVNDTSCREYLDDLAAGSGRKFNRLFLRRSSSNGACGNQAKTVCIVDYADPPSLVCQSGPLPRRGRPIAHRQRSTQEIRDDMCGIIGPGNKKQMAVLDCHQTSVRNELCQNAAVYNRHNWIIGPRYDQRRLSQEA